MDQRNLLLAAIISITILLGWHMLFEQPRIEAQRNAQQQRQAQQQATPQQPAASQPGSGAAPQAPAVGVTPPAETGVVPTAPVIGAPQQPQVPQRATVLQQAPRIKPVSPRVHGSIRLRGGQIDDLTLIDYHETTDPKSPEITLLSPAQAPKPYFAQFGWVSGDAAMPVPNEDTVWKSDANEISPERPVTLSWDNGRGLTFYKTIALDRNYMFTVTQRVQNATTQPVTLFPYALVSRSGTPKTLGFYILHEGPLGVLNGQLVEIDYDEVQEKGKIEQASKGGWIGLTDKYWLVALVPDQKSQHKTAFRHTLAGKLDKYQVDYLGDAQVVAPGASSAVSNRLFAGAKEVNLLDEYAEKLQIARFDLAIDFGWFYFLTKPIFYVLEYFYRLIGNFGLAILLLTVIIKILFFPLANKSYKAMSRLKQLQPKMVAIRDRYGDDRAKQNEAMMRLYKEEKVNPAAGCLPMLVVNIEMRHAPFYGWIHDLSAPDPTSLFNLFGLVPWTPPEFLMIGVWPLIMGVTMFLQQKLNPAPADPMQAKIFMLLPIVFTFILAPFPAGLVIYWAWNNVLSIAQQWVIMRQMGVKVGS